MPTEKEKWLKFHDGQYQFKAPFILHDDFESILKPVDEWYRVKMNTMETDRKGKAPYTEKMNIHTPLKMYQGKFCVKKFVEYREEEVKWLYATFPQQPMIKLTDVLKREHKAAEKRNICLKEFNDPKDRKLRDHCHYTGLYRGVAHSNCNLKYRSTYPDHIPIVFHNLSGYDAHLFIKELGKKFNKDDIGVIAENKEKYISFNIKINIKLAGVKHKDGTEVCKNIQLRFTDSFRVMASSLDKLASDLEDDQCKHLREFYKEEDVFRLMRHKGIYPYKYMDGWEKFEETSLPPKNAFYSRLNMKGISDQDYEHVQQVWNIMEKKTLGCYHDAYLKADVLLLADVFETLRDTCLRHYKLDPSHFYTAPGLA